MNQFVKSSGYIAKMPILNTIYSLVGASVAANETGFDVLGMNGVSLDAGISQHNANYTFITHTHHDHTKSIISNVLNQKNSKMNIYCPRGSYSLLKEKMEKEYNATKHNIKTEYPWRLIGVLPNETFQIKTAGKFFNVETVQCTHSIACTGYCFTEIRNKVIQSHLDIVNTFASEKEKQEYFRDLQNKNINLIVLSS